MTIDEAEAVVRRLGEKVARKTLLHRRLAETEGEIATLEKQIGDLGTHAATAAAVLESRDRGAAAAQELIDRVRDGG